MSENGSRWTVDTIDEMGEEVSLFDAGIHGLIGDAEFWPISGDAEIRDFVVELVREIERLQTENIEQAGAAKCLAKLQRQIIVLAEIDHNVGLGHE